MSNSIEVVEKMLRIARVEKDLTNIWGPIIVYPYQAEALRAVIEMARAYEGKPVIEQESDSERVS